MAGRGTIFRSGASNTVATGVNDESRLVARTLAGDPEAFAVLVKTYQDRLFNSLVYATNRPQEAEEIAQETFVQAFLKLESFRQESAFYTWLYRIAMNLLATRRRNTKPLISVERSLLPSRNEPAEDREPSHRSEQADRQRAVQRALATLSEEHRRIVVLREMDGCDYEAIADILKVTVGTVRSRLHRARQQLRAALANEVENLL